MFPISWILSIVLFPVVGVGAQPSENMPAIEKEKKVNKMLHILC